MVKKGFSTRNVRGHAQRKKDSTCNQRTDSSRISQKKSDFRTTYWGTSAHDSTSHCHHRHQDVWRGLVCPLFRLPSHRTHRFLASKETDSPQASRGSGVGIEAKRHHMAMFVQETLFQDIFGIREDHSKKVHGRTQMAFQDHCICPGSAVFDNSYDLIPRHYVSIASL